MTTEMTTPQLIEAAKVHLHEEEARVAAAEADVDACREIYIDRGDAESKKALSVATKRLAAAYESAALVAGRVEALGQRAATELQAREIARRAPMNERIAAFDRETAALQAQVVDVLSGFLTDLETLDRELVEHAEAAAALARESLALPEQAGFRRTPRTIPPLSAHAGVLGNLKRLIAEGLIRPYQGA